MVGGQAFVYKYSQLNKSVRKVSAFNSNAYMLTPQPLHYQATHGGIEMCILLLTPATVAPVRHLAAFVYVCAVLSRSTEMTENTIMKLGTGIVHHNTSPTN